MIRDPNSRKKYAALLDDPNFNRWYSNLSKGSLIAADIRLRSIGRFCDVIGKTPKEFVSLPQGEMEDVAQDYLDKLESSTNPNSKAPYSPGYLSNCLDAIRSWADWNRKAFQRTIKITNPNRTPSLDDERAPTQDELRRVLYGDKTSLRTRASIALIAFAGMRPEVQGNYRGTEGLRIKDFVEIEIVNSEVSFKKIPTAIVVREEISKIRKQYLTFLNEEGCEVVKDYLERRIRDGEKLTPKSAVIAAFKNQEGRQANFGIEDQSPFLATTKISEAIREAMRRVGIPFRPYVWRVYFDTALLIAEGKGLISHAFQQFIMGHSGDIERTYTLSKHKLPDQISEDIRGAVKRAAQFLETRRPKDSETQMKKAFWEGLLLTKYTQEEVSKFDIESMSNEELVRLMREKLGIQSPAISRSDDKSPTDQHYVNEEPRPLPSLRNNGSPIDQAKQQERHAAIPLSQLRSFLSSGCLFVDKFVDPETSQPLAIVELRL